MIFKAVFGTGTMTIILQLHMNFAYRTTLLHTARNAKIKFDWRSKILVTQLKREQIQEDYHKLILLQLEQALPFLSL